MSEFLLILNGVEIPVRDVEIRTKERWKVNEMEIEAKDGVIQTEDVGELLASLMIDGCNPTDK